MITLALLIPTSLTAMACDAPISGEGRVASVTDARTFLLEGGREVRLAGIELMQDGGSASGAARSALAVIVAGKLVTLRSSKPPDRYGRIVAYAFEPGTQESAQVSIQSQLVAQGWALASSGPDGKGCGDDLRKAENGARQEKKGLWAGSAAIKSAEMPNDILAGVGQYAVVEGRILSVREAGAIVYINFGRRWTRDFAVTISRRRMAVFEAAGFGAKALENRRIRVRGWVERRGGPRIEALAPDQIEFVNGT